MDRLDLASLTPARGGPTLSRAAGAASNVNATSLSSSSAIELLRISSPLSGVDRRFPRKHDAI
jgi:hypothetical protein